MGNGQRTPEERDEILKQYDELRAQGETHKGAADRVGVSPYTITAWKSGGWSEISHAKRPRKTKKYKYPKTSSGYTAEAKPQPIVVNLSDDGNAQEFLAMVKSQLAALTAIVNSYERRTT